MMCLNRLPTIASKLNFLRANQFDKIRLYSSTVNHEGPFVKKTGSKHDVALITLGLSETPNALNDSSLQELAKNLNLLRHDKSIGAIILTGNGKSFSLGTDATTSAGSTNLVEDALSSISKPVIAAVNGYAFNFGFELAMMCDFILAGNESKFSLQEVSMGTLPRAGGSQRLPRTVGKAKAMEMILTGCEISAYEAQQMGLVCKVYPTSQLLDEAIKMGEKLATYSQLISQISKECIDTALESTLSEGIRFEKLMANATFATKDWKEGTTAFMAKRPPQFTHE